MNSRLSWSVEGIDPSVRERAEAAARRAGMSLSDWLNSTIGDFTPPDFRAPPVQRPAPAGRQTPDVADIHQRLDSITRQIEQISQPRPRSDMPRSDTLRNEMPRGDAPRRSPILRRRRKPGLRTTSAGPTWSSARLPRSTAPLPPSARYRSTSRSRRSLRARANLIVGPLYRCRRAARRQWRLPCRRGRIFPRSSAI